MPNLALFANAGFPFTRFADLGETAIVLPDTADRAALEQLFFLLGRMGRQTGAAALAYRLIDTREALEARDVDLLVLSGALSNELLEHWGQGLALAFGKVGRDYRQPARAPNSMIAPGRRDETVTAPDVVVQANGSLAALMSFESRVTSGRTVVALVGTDASAADSLVATLEDDGKVALIRGELAIVRSDGTQSFSNGDAYYVGSLSVVAMAVVPFLASCALADARRPGNGCGRWALHLWEVAASGEEAPGRPHRGLTRDQAGVSRRAGCGIAVRRERLGACSPPSRCARHLQ